MPDRPNWAPLLIIRKRKIVTTKVLVELPLEFDSITCTGIIGTCNYLEVSVSHQIWWLTYANKSEKRSNGTVVN